MIEFIKYFREFYDVNGLYPLGFTFTDRQIELCVELRGSNFEGDSIDREAIRDILLVANNMLGGAFCFNGIKTGEVNGTK